MNLKTNYLLLNNLYKYLLNNKNIKNYNYHTYHIIKHFYNKKKNSVNFILQNKLFIELYCKQYTLKIPMFNIFLHKWFYIK